MPVSYDQATSPPSDITRVIEQLGRWRDDLVNLGRRNRLLYFSPSRVSTVQIQSPDVDETLRLVIRSRGKGAAFFYPPDPNVPEESGKVPKQGELVTDQAEPASLERALKAIERRATQEFTDKGLWVLYLAAGMLRWIDPEDHQEVRSPVLLVPVLATRSSPREPYRLLPVEEEPVVNPVLALKLRSEFGIEVGNLTTFDYEDLGTGVAKQILDQVSKRTARRREWSVTPELVLSNFSFHKEVIYRDLDANKEIIARHPVIQTLALGDRANNDLGFEPVSEDILDESPPPEELTTILDCDATQRRAIVAARDGHTFVMDGPPGTGKSQTIANIIAEVLAMGKTVLFVSEKAAALDVVAKRLKERGLEGGRGDFVLSLHSHKATRKEVATELAEAITSRPSIRRSLSEADRRHLMDRRRELSAYARAMNEIRQPLGVSLHWTLGRIAALQRLAQAPPAQTLGIDLEPDVFNDVLDAARQIAGAWGPVERDRDFHWREVGDASLNSSRRQEIGRQIDDAAGVISEIQARAEGAIGQFALEWNIDSIATSRRVLALLDHMQGRPEVPPTWWTGGELQDLAARIQEVKDLTDRSAASIEDLISLIGDRWRDLLPDGAQSFAAAIGQLRALPSAWEPAADWNAEAIQAAASFAAAKRDSLPGVRESVLEVGRTLGLQDERISWDRALKIADAGLLAGESAPPERHWLSPGTLASLQEALPTLEELVNEDKELRLSVLTVFSEAALDLDLDGLCVRFQTIHKGLKKLGSSYRSDKKAVASTALSGKATRDVVALLPQVREWKKVRQRLQANDDRYRKLFGDRYFLGPSTDISRTRSAVQVAERALQLVGEDLNDRLRDQLARDGKEDAALPLKARQVGKALRELRSGLTATFSPVGRLASLTLEELIAWLDRAGPPISTLADIVERADSVARVPLTFEVVGKALALRSSVEAVETELGARQTDDEQVLGALFRRSDTDWDALQNALGWSQALRVLMDGPASDETAARIEYADLHADVAPQSEALREALSLWSKRLSTLTANFTQIRAEEVAADLGSSFHHALWLLTELKKTLPDLVEWAMFEEALSRLSESGLGPAIEFCRESRIERDQVVGIIERSVREAWADAILRSDVRLKHVTAKERDRYVYEFRQLDRDLIEAASARVAKVCNLRRPSANPVGAVALIQRQGQLKKRHMPIRRLLAEAGTVAQQLKPCFMMTPLTVSQFLPPDLQFDVVIFDEASQVMPADAINCIYRGAQLVVAGDQKQLPPTSFFWDLGSQDDTDEYEEGQFDQYDSILDLCKASQITSIPLLWHYRSQHEGLITFSNRRFYDGQLISFPGARELGPDVGIEFIKVDGIYRRGGRRDNPTEAAAVVDRVLIHARARPNASLGIVAFSEAQASAIEAELDRRRSEQPELAELDDYFSGDRLTGFFIKNLENVQGDERDIILFSVGYGKDEAGKLTMTFGPLNRPDGWRRLNVAVTRARQRVEIFSSIDPTDFPVDLANPSIAALRDYMRFAQDGVGALLGTPEGSLGPAESPFEHEVAHVIRTWGYDAVPQLGAAGYRIDVAVRDPRRPGRLLIGVECDGAMYHMSKAARDRDRLRQEVLENLGWTLHRIWGPAWYGNRAGEEDRLRDALERAGTRGGPPTAHVLSPVEAVVDDVQLSEVPAWAVLYEPARLSRVSSSFPIYDSSSQFKLRSQIKSVVETEGPVAETVVLRRVREAWGLGSAGSRVQTAFGLALRALDLSKELRKDQEGFLRIPGMTLSAVRLPNTREQESNRTVDQVPWEELELAIVHLVDDAHRIRADELTTAVSRLFGWKRRGPDIQDQLDLALRRLLRAHKLSKQGSTLYPGKIGAGGS